MECALVVTETLVNQPEVTPRPPQSLPDDTIVILELLFFCSPFTAFDCNDSQMTYKHNWPMAIVCHLWLVEIQQCVVLSIWVLTQDEIFDAVRIILESIFGFEQMFGKQWKWLGEALMTEQMMFPDVI